MKQQVAVKGPVACGIDSHIDRQAFGWFDVDGVFQWILMTMTIIQNHPHAVEVYGVVHHGIINESQADSFSVNQSYGFRSFRKLFSVERPHVAFHIAGQVQLDLSPGMPLIRPGLECL